MNHPLGTIKDLTTDTVTKGVTLPIRLAARTFGVALGVASVGRHVAREVVGRGASAASEAAGGEPAGGIRVPQPVNVVEELDLDPAPVGQTRAGSEDADEPLTSIDAQADPADVDATPADVAERISATAPGPRHSE